MRDPLLYEVLFLGSIEGYAELAVIYLLGIELEDVSTSSICAELPGFIHELCKL